MNNECNFWLKQIKLTTDSYTRALEKLDFYIRH